MSPSQYKLIYFNAKGRAECARLIFAQAGVVYEDYRLDRSQWSTIKPTILPFGQVPVLEIDGKLLPQSKAICRYLAKQFNLIGKNDFEAALCDAYVDSVDEANSGQKGFRKEQDPEKKRQLMDKHAEENVKPMLARFETILIENGTGYLVGNQVTWADLSLFDSITKLAARQPDLLTPFSKLNEFVSRIEQLPNIKSWIEKRPKTEN